MTLVINVLHKDFSLLAADRQANANGPTTITAGGLTINLSNGGTITGLFPKVITTANCTAAVVVQARSPNTHTCAPSRPPQVQKPGSVLYVTPLMASSTSQSVSVSSAGKGK